MTTTFPTPSSDGYTIYSKSGCSFCVKVKELLVSNNMPFTEIQCDSFLTVTVKEPFLAHIKKLANKEYRTFPMVFFHGIFIGGYTETKQYEDMRTSFL